MHAQNLIKMQIWCGNSTSTHSHTLEQMKILNALHVCSLHQHSCAQKHIHAHTDIQLKIQSHAYGTQIIFMVLKHKKPIWMSGWLTVS